MGREQLQVHHREAREFHRQVEQIHEVLKTGGDAASMKKSLEDVTSVCILEGVLCPEVQALLKKKSPQEVLDMLVESPAHGLTVPGGADDRANASGLLSVILKAGGAPKDLVDELLRRGDCVRMAMQHPASSAELCSEQRGVGVDPQSPEKLFLLVDVLTDRLIKGEAHRHHWQGPFDHHQAHDFHRQVEQIHEGLKSGDDASMRKGLEDVNSVRILEGVLRPEVQALLKEKSPQEVLNMLVESPAHGLSVPGADDRATASVLLPVILEARGAPKNSVDELLRSGDSFGTAMRHAASRAGSSSEQRGVGVDPQSPEKLFLLVDVLTDRLISSYHVAEQPEALRAAVESGDTTSVKQILERTTCVEILQGTLLTAIKSTNPRDVVHEVVRALLKGRHWKVVCAMCQCQDDTDDQNAFAAAVAKNDIELINMMMDALRDADKPEVQQLIAQGNAPILALQSSAWRLAWRLFRESDEEMKYQMVCYFSEQHQQMLPSEEHVEYRYFCDLLKAILHWMQPSEGHEEYQYFCDLLKAILHRMLPSEGYVKNKDVRELLRAILRWNDKEAARCETRQEELCEINKMIMNKLRWGDLGESEDSDTEVENAKKPAYTTYTEIVKYLYKQEVEPTDLELRRQKGLDETTLLTQVHAACDREKLFVLPTQKGRCVVLLEKNDRYMRNELFVDPHGIKVPWSDVVIREIQECIPMMGDLATSDTRVAEFMIQNKYGEDYMHNTIGKLTIGKLVQIVRRARKCVPPKLVVDGKQLGLPGMAATPTSVQDEAFFATQERVFVLLLLSEGSGVGTMAMSHIIDQYKNKFQIDLKEKKFGPGGVKLRLKQLIEGMQNIRIFEVPRGKHGGMAPYATVFSQGFITKIQNVCTGLAAESREEGLKEFFDKEIREAQSRLKSFEGVEDPHLPTSEEVENSGGMDLEVAKRNFSCTCLHRLDEIREVGPQVLLKSRNGPCCG